MLVSPPMVLVTVLFPCHAHPDAAAPFRQRAEPSHSVRGEVSSSGSRPAHNATPSRAPDHAARPTPIPDPVDPPLVAIDRSETAYTVFLAVAKDAPEEQLEQLRSRAAQEEAVDLVT